VGTKFSRKRLEHDVQLQKAAPISGLEVVKPDRFVMSVLHGSNVEVCSANVSIRTGEQNYNNQYEKNKIIFCIHKFM